MEHLFQNVPKRKAEHRFENAGSITYGVMDIRWMIASFKSVDSVVLYIVSTNSSMVI